MKCFVFGILLVHANACLKPAATTVHIQNYDGPIYVTPGDNCSPTLSNVSPTCDNRYPTLKNCAPTYDNRCPTLNCAPTCDNRCPTFYCDNRYPTLTNPTTCDNQSPAILHSSTVPYHQTICETDCKCVTKHQTACVPVSVNSVPQNSCTPVYVCSQCPEGYYGYGYPEGQAYSPETDTSSCPRISETLIPLLKTYLAQGSGNCPKCGQNHSKYYS